MTIRLQLGRPSTSADLTQDDFDMIDDARFTDFQRWDERRTCGGGAYHLGEFSIPEVFAWMRWVKGYCITLRQRLRESKSAQHIRELERENGRLSQELSRMTKITTVESLAALRGENAGLRRELEACRRTMAKWQIRRPGR